MEESTKYVLPYELEDKFSKALQVKIQELRKEKQQQVQESLEKGLKKGKKADPKQGEEKRTIEIAKRMFLVGYSPTTIASLSGLKASILKDHAPEEVDLLETLLKKEEKN